MISITSTQRTAIHHLLVRYILSSLSCGWISTARFYCEILTAVEPNSEEAVFLFALTLYNDSCYVQAIELISSAPSGVLHYSNNCKWLYAKCCAKIPGKEAESRSILESLLSNSNPASIGNFTLPPPPAELNSTVLLNDLARASAQSKYHSKASEYFQRALSECWWCWEAWDGLCTLGVKPNIDDIYGSKAGGPSRTTNITTTTTTTNTAAVAANMSTPTPLPPKLNGYGSSSNLASSLFTPTITTPTTTNTTTTTTRRSTRLAGSGAVTTATTANGVGKKRSRTAMSGSGVYEDKDNLDEDVMDDNQVFAEEWLRAVVKSMASIRLASSCLDSQKVVNELRSLPDELRISWRCQMWLANAKYESLEYDDAEKAFTRARAWAPYLISGLELYSTLLYLLQKPVALSTLAQELMMLDPLSPCSWIAAGNVFSSLDDHANALKCFKRAVQVDDLKNPGCSISEGGDAAVYAQTLAGHECADMEEWERALGCYREALRRNNRHYNAWFGIGNVYMKTGKLRLAEYHFRRALEINSSNALLMSCVGIVLERLNRKREALDIYNTAHNLAPYSPVVLHKRATVLFALKQYNAALKDLLVLKDLAPEEFNVHFLLGRLYAKMGQQSLMTKHLTYAQDIQPGQAHRIREILEGEVDSSHS